MTGRVVSSTYLDTTVRYRIGLAGQRLTLDDPDPARIRLWPATQEGLKQLGENTGSWEGKKWLPVSWEPAS